MDARAKLANGRPTKSACTRSGPAIMSANTRLFSARSAKPWNWCTKATRATLMCTGPCWRRNSWRTGRRDGTRWMMCLVFDLCHFPSKACISGAFSGPKPWLRVVAVNNQANQAEKRQILGLIVIMFAAGFPGAMLAGFFAPWPWGIESTLGLAAAGRLVGGLLMAPRLFWAGALGGLIAGPLGLTALYFYARWRDQLWSTELVVVQAVA